MNFHTTTKTKKAFTLIELLTVMAMVSILASVVLVGYGKIRENIRDKDAYTHFLNTLPAANRCIRSGVSDVGLGVNVASTCVTDPEGTPMPISGFSDWPTLSSATGWDYAGGFFWCDVNSNLSTPPTPVVDYQNGVAGGDRNTGKLCYMLQNLNDNTKKIWCTKDGCERAGF